MLQKKKLKSILNRNKQMMKNVEVRMQYIKVKEKINVLHEVIAFKSWFMISF